MIALRNIVKRYRMGDEEVMALDGVDLDIGRNEYVALVGPSGSGKSTLMNIIGCLDSPSEGSYLLNGRDTAKLGEVELAGCATARLVSCSRVSTCCRASPCRGGTRAGG